MAILVLLNNFTHDFSAAGWLFCTVVLWSILRRDTVGEPAVVEIIKTVLVLMKVSLFGIIVFGIFRALAYKTYEWNAAAGDSQVTLLIVKHVILLGIFVFGVVYYARARKVVRGKSNQAGVE